MLMQIISRIRKLAKIVAKSLKLYPRLKVSWTRNLSRLYYKYIRERICTGNQTNISKQIQFLKLLLGEFMYFWSVSIIFFHSLIFIFQSLTSEGDQKWNLTWQKSSESGQINWPDNWLVPKVLLSVVKVCRCLWNSLKLIFSIKVKKFVFCHISVENQSKCQNSASILINIQTCIDYILRTGKAKRWL